MQLDFNLPEIDRGKTKNAVERALETYRMYSLQVSLARLTSITASYSLAPAASNLLSSSTENAVNRLTLLERTIIFKRYLDENELFDYQIYAKFNISERNYYRIKSRLFYKLAFALKIEVYREEGTPS